MLTRNRRRHSQRPLFRSRRLLAEQLEDRRLLAVTFEFNYIGGNSIGFNDPVQGSIFREALETAAARLGDQILQDAAIQMDVQSFAFSGSAVGKAVSRPAPAVASGGFFPAIIPAKILGQGDGNGAAADGDVEVFFFSPSDPFRYATTPEDADEGDEIDFQAVIIHELVHTIGMTSTTTENGSDDFGNGITTPGSWSLYDRFLSDVDGNRFINDDASSPTAFQMDVTPDAWPEHSVGGIGPNAGLFFDGPIASRIHGSRVPLYSPNEFMLESSVSHLDSEGFPNEPFLFSPLTHLMSHAIVTGPVPQDLTLLEKAILTDIGIRIDVTNQIEITWPTPDDITFGTALSDQQLNATANVDGTFVYTPSLDTILNAGAAQTLTVTFTPDDLAVAEPIETTVSLNVLKADPVINWPTPDPITFGTELDDTQLNASSGVPGSIAYTPEAGTVLDVGNDQVLSAVFTPVDTTNFNETTTSVFIDVTPATPVVTWDDPADIPFLTPLGPDQLNAQASVDGTFAYAPPAGVLLGVGSDQQLSVTFTPDSPNFESVTTTASINVIKRTPVIVWDDPTDIVEGTALSEVQLNATTELQIAGTFTYDPPLGTLLSIGDDQPLNVTFTPNVTDNFDTVESTVNINVLAPQDYGDAPNEYPVLLAQDGARHSTTSLVLGTQVDLDLDGSPSEQADGDGDDDDGVQSIADVVAVADASSASSVTVTTSEAGKLDGWIDFNGDGDWDDPGEQILVNVDVSAGENLFGFNVPAGASAGDTAARFRISTAGGLAPTGSAPDGEVEDYLYTLLDGSASADATVALVGGAVSVGVEANQLVVRSGATQLFGAPPASLTSLSVVGGDVDETVTLDVGDGFVVPSGGLSLDGRTRGNTLVVVGDGGEVDLTDGTINVIDFRRLDLSSADVNRVVIDGPTVARMSPALNLLTVTTTLGDSLVVADGADWRMTEPVVVDGTFMLTADNAETGGSESIEATVPRPWQNFLQIGDVNNDGMVSASDALRIINELGRRSFSDPTTQDLNDPQSVAIWPGAYFDHNGDNRATALDALRVINDVARQSLNNGSGEQPDVPATTSLSTPARDESWRLRNSLPGQASSGDANFATTPRRQEKESGDRSQATGGSVGDDVPGDRGTNEESLPIAAVDHLLASADWAQN